MSIKLNEILHDILEVIPDHTCLGIDRLKDSQFVKNYHDNEFNLFLPFTVLMTLSPQELAENTRGQLEDLIRMRVIDNLLNISDLCEDLVKSLKEKTDDD